jgi:hypothetical protein
MTDPFSTRLAEEEPDTAPPALGPAVSPRTVPSGSPLGALDEPLAPFVRSATPAPAPEWGLSAAAAEAEPISAPAVAAPEEEDSLAWLWADDAGALSLEVTDEASLDGEEPWTETADPLLPLAEVEAQEPTPELPSEPEPWLTLEEEGHAQPVAPSPDVALPTPGAEGNPSEWLAALADASGAQAPAAESPTPPLPTPQHLPAVLQEVADRLERIARSLRDQKPAPLFGESGADPLQLLITGYALGFSEAQREKRDEGRGKREE